MAEKSNLISSADLTKLVDTVVSASAKADDDPSEKARTLDGLKALKKQPVNTRILSETGAGKRLRSLAKHSNAEIATAATEVVASWKAIVQKETGSSQGGTQSMSVSMAEKSKNTAAPATTTSQGGGTQTTTTVNTAAATAGGSQLTNQPSGSLAGSQGTSLITVPDIPRSGDAIRDKIRDNFASALAKAVAEGAQGEVAALAVLIEEALLKAHNGVSQTYKSKFRQLHFNLKDDKNPDLRRKVLTGEISPDELITLSPEELASDEKRDENQKIRDKKLFDSAPSAAKKATTDQFQCGKCKQRKCTYYQMQTRSADEPMTTFVTCLECNNRWKFC